MNQANVVLTAAANVRWFRWEQTGFAEEVFPVRVRWSKSWPVVSDPHMVSVAVVTARPVD